MTSIYFQALIACKNGGSTQNNQTCIAWAGTHMFNETLQSIAIYEGS